MKTDLPAVHTQQAPRISRCSRAAMHLRRLAREWYRQRCRRQTRELTE